MGLVYAGCFERTHSSSPRITTLYDDEAKERPREYALHDEDTFTSPSALETLLWQ